EVGGVDLLRCRSRGLGAEAAVLDHHDDDELRVVGRRPGRVPGVVAAGRGFRGSGLAGDLDREGAEDGAGRARVGTADQTVPDRRYGGEAEVPPGPKTKLADDLPAGVEHGLADVRADDRAAVRERRVGDGELERCDRELALPDGEVDRVTLVPDPLPGLLEGPLQPRRGGDEAGGLARDVEAGGMPDAEATRPILHVEMPPLLLGVEHRAEAVEPGVAGDRKRLGQRQARVDMSLDVMEDMVADGV